jgi:hypothetical protein
MAQRVLFLETYHSDTKLLPILDFGSVDQRCVQIMVVVSSYATFLLLAVVGSSYSV